MKNGSAPSAVRTMVRLFSGLMLLGLLAPATGCANRATASLTPGADLSRGYIQSWFRGREVPERSAQRILHAADQIVKAGTEETK